MMARKKDSSIPKSHFRSYQSPRGMKDILPVDYKYYDYILRQAQKVLSFYGVQRIETPILEKAELYQKGIGAHTDMVETEMYILKTKDSGELLALRPEYTAGIVRAYIENGMTNWMQPVKLYSFGPVFRHEKPQQGRYRQFYQLNIENIGSPSAITDAEIILITKDLLESWGFKSSQLKLRLNSIGCPTCRKEYLKVLKRYYRRHQSQLNSIDKKRLITNPLRLLDSKDPKVQELKEGAPSVLDYLCSDCKSHFKKVLEILGDLNISYVLDKTLVRGLDYYSRTVFEFYFQENSDNEHKAKPLAIAGGGRYDYLVERLGGSHVPAVGVAFGVERIAEQLKKLNRTIKGDDAQIFLIQIGDTAQKKSLSLLEEFRKKNIKVAESFGKSSLRAQLKDADRLKVRYTLILGQKEVLDGMIILRDMKSGIQELLPLDNVVDLMKKRIGKL